MSIDQFKKTKKQELLNKHAKFFAADKKEPRDIFKGIRYEKNGAAYVSDTHILLRMKNVSPFLEPHIVHALTGAEIDGEYVSQKALEDLINWNPENQLILDSRDQIASIAAYAKIAQLAGKELRSDFKHVRLSLASKRAYLQFNDKGFELNASIGAPVNEQEETWTFNADYVSNAFNLFKNAESGKLAIKFKGGSLAPIIISDDENEIDVLILPIRS